MRVSVDSWKVGKLRSREYSVPELQKCVADRGPALPSGLLVGHVGCFFRGLNDQLL